MTLDEAEQMIQANMAADADDIEAYVYGPDDPEDYFSKIDTVQELIQDFQDFLRG